MGLLFTLECRVILINHNSKDILILLLKKKKPLESVYILEMAPKVVFLMLFCNFLGINPHNFAKNHLILKSKGWFHAKFLEFLEF